jgi:hypothetical protein
MSMKLQRDLHNNECSHNLMRVAHKSVRLSPLSQIAVTSCHDLPLCSSAPNSGCNVYTILYPKSGQSVIQKSASSVIVVFPEATEMTKLHTKGHVASKKQQCMHIHRGHWIPTPTQISEEK